MGYQDRDYYREDTADSGFQIKSWTVRLIIVNCVIFLANILTSSSDRSNPLGQDQLTLFLANYGNTIVDPWHWWRFLTAGFVHSDAIWHIAGNMIGLYVFGKPFEEKRGGKELLRFYLLAIVLGNVVWSARQYLTVGPIGPDHWMHCVGASGGVTALIVLFCLENPRATLLLFFAIRTPAWMVGILIVLSDLTGARLPGQTVEHIAFDVHLTGAAFATAYWALGLNFGRVPGTRELATGWNKLTSLFRSRPQVRVHRHDDDEELDDNLEEEADRLLAKIAREGESSLNARERRILEDYSRRMREKRR